MEDILHHLECLKPCKEWDKLDTYQPVQDFLHHQYHVKKWPLDKMMISKNTLQVKEKRVWRDRINRYKQNHQRGP